ncbi:conjugative transfer protein [Salmonella enterica subsp. enterica serovar Typhimurium]|nr:conjugative transfer protein [Salmonella enterica subsp. enterica serovar Typhimurium]
MSTKQKQTDGTGARKRDGLWMIPGCLGMVVLNAAIQLRDSPAEHAGDGGIQHETDRGCVF